MRIFIYFILITTTLFACSGDCMKCHPKLLKNGKLDKNHEILSKCINCHKINSNDLERMGSLCGQDCWDCHSVEKVTSIKNKEHLSLNGCIECHKKLKKYKIFKKDSINLKKQLFKGF